MDRGEIEMNRKQNTYTWVLAVALTALASSSLPARAAGPRTSPNQVTVTVTVIPKQGNRADLTAQDVLVYQNQERRPVIDWKPADSASPLDLAILMDDSLASDVGVQWNDLRQFVRVLPASTRVAILYARHGDAAKIQDFTTDHELALRAFRVPVGKANEISSVFQAVTDLVKHWPEDGNRRALVVVSDGIDLFYDATSSLPTQNPNLDRAIEAAQRAQVTAFAIYARTAGNFANSLYLVNNGQGSLDRLARETGGEAFFQGTETPIAFQPFLSQLGRDLSRQYVLTFEAAQGKGAYERLRVTTEQPHVELIAPTRVFVPNSNAG